MRVVRGLPLILRKSEFRMPWLIMSPAESRTVFRNGITPGDRYSEAWSRLSDVIEAGALGGEPTDQLLHLPGPADEGPKTEIREFVEGDRINLVSYALSAFSPLPAHHALDNVADPLANPESFAKTAVVMSSEAYGDLIGDAAFDEQENNVLAYTASYYIDVLPVEGAEDVKAAGPEEEEAEVLTRQDILEAEKEGRVRFGLLLERDYFTSDEGLTLEDLERKLFDWARLERDMEIWREAALSDDGPSL